MFGKLGGRMLSVIELFHLGLTFLVFCAIRMQSKGTHAGFAHVMWYRNVAVKNKTQVLFNNLWVYKHFFNAVFSVSSTYILTKVKMQPQWINIKTFI